ncbi:phosphoribosylanthranilate isomerase [Sporosarcina sp. HYO08]|uniref:phosphoribosylanthranilate isomerase n=1 Tax=Sporosarcina sp. HYO08 TaxID=1759557 RepID=UPI0007943F21|nr:phosphoribosylanthranilate isomerase [Sporosarcina sp. HYO08]KXH80678.1 N-(5'-phosphoribosyl)anthranilate isomerase [Sporosarcina sp. HYO08]
MTKVKICGLMEKQHVKAAVDAGADAIGFVFAPSKRRVTVEQARELAKEIPPHVLKIGVVVDASREELETYYREVPLDYIQYHGDEAPGLIEQLGFPSIKALSIRSEEDVIRAAQYETDFFLFDAPGTDYKGGSGNTFDWSLMEASGIGGDRIILAGGLNAANVKEAIARVKPYMVDVSSGVESNGKKDEQLIRTFLHTVKDGER